MSRLSASATVWAVPATPRDRAPGFHHVWVNATGNWAYFLDDIDRMTWLRRLIVTLGRFGWRCIAFCLMTTHVHLLLLIEDESLPEGMRDLNREYSKDFNARHERAGSFLRKRYGSRRVEGRRDLLDTYAYVVLNPVKEGLCERAEEWRWNSYATTIGLANDFPFVDVEPLLAELGSTLEEARATLSEFVAAQAEGHVRRRHVRYQVPDVSGWDESRRPGASAGPSSTP